MARRSIGFLKPSKKNLTETLRKIVNEIHGGQRFLIAAHENPEGDAIGSMLALGLALRALQKQVVFLNQDPTPEALAFLPGAEEIRHEAPEIDDRFDLAFALDCGDHSRLGTEFAKVQRIGKLINIDHHLSNRYFGDINYVDPWASSACEIVFDLLRALPLGLTQAIAQNIYTGILTDTGSFHYSNTTAKTFAVSRACLRAGVDPWKIAQMVYEFQPLPRLRLLALALSTLESAAGGRIHSIWVSRKMLEETKATKAMTEDFINYPRSIRGVEVALFFREEAPLRYRVSLRSRGAVDVSAIAQEFQGGGHPSAAGCTLEGSLAEVKTKILERVRAAF